MRIHAITLQGFKPLLHRQVQLLQMTFPTPATAILGINGSGKSSVLRELTPLPATKTDYLEGKKELTVEHEGKMYRLVSDFKKPKAHSFWEGDTDLNPSGTATVQEELVRQVFGYTPLIGKLTSFKYPICDLGKVERRDLLFNTHPNDLDFLTKDYRLVTAQLRVMSNNIKMLTSRQVELEQLLLKPDVYRQLQHDERVLGQVETVLSQVMVVLRSHREQLQADPRYQDYPSEYQTIAEIQDRLIGWEQETRKLLQQHPDLAGPQVGQQAYALERRAETLMQQMLERQQEAKAILEELQLCPQLISAVDQLIDVQRR
jgi:DNA repair exonuclease SbcCD ATPase subunit